MSRQRPAQTGARARKASLCCNNARTRRWLIWFRSGSAAPIATEYYKPTPTALASAWSKFTTSGARRRRRSARGLPSLVSSKLFWASPWKVCHGGSSSDTRPATRDPNPNPNSNPDRDSETSAHSYAKHEQRFQLRRLLRHPLRPQHLLATAILSGQIALPGTENSNSESCFQIHRSSDDVTFSLIATVRDNVITYTDNGRTAVDLLLSSTGYRPLPPLLVKLQHQQHPQLKPDLLTRSAIISQTSRG